MLTIYTTKDTPCQTLQKIMDDAVTAKWLRETREPLPNPQAAGSRLSGETIYNILLKEGN